LALGILKHETVAGPLGFDPFMDQLCMGAALKSCQALHSIEAAIRAEQQSAQWSLDDELSRVWMMSCSFPFDLKCQ